MKKLGLVLLGVVLVMGMMVNNNALNAKGNILAEDIPYEWIINDNGNLVAEDIPYEW